MTRKFLAKKKKKKKTEEEEEKSGTVYICKYSWNESGSHHGPWAEEPKCSTCDDITRVFT